MASARYSIIPTAAVKDADLTPLQFRCLCLIGSYLGSDQTSFPRQSTLATDLQVSREAINRSIKVLRAKGYITVQSRFRDDGGQMSSLYQVILDVPVEPCDLQITPGVKRAGHTGGDNAGSHQEDTQKKIPKEDSVREIFDFYNATAKRVGWVVHASLVDAIKGTIKARVREHGAEKVKAFIEAMASQSWTYEGFRSNPGFRASLTFICRPRTFAEHFDKLCPPEAPARRILDLHNGLTRDNWWTAVQWFYDSDGQWDLDHISPPPGQPGCLAPPDMLKEIAR